MSIQPFSQYQSWPIVLEGVIFIIFSIKLYRQLLNTTSDLLLLPSFWINTGIYLYFALDLFLFIIISFMFKNMSQEMRDTVWGFHNFINAIKNILFAIGIYFVNAQQEKEYSK
ncbi:MAG: hypothetical protein IPJ81_07860 [Chitinophagaceae bacterium]|nr:hypothetical protein [Chitinophagaceae bacterium]